MQSRKTRPSPARHGKRLLAFLVAAAVVLFTAVAGAQQDFSAVEIRTTVLAPNLAMLQGAGGNIAVVHDEQGALLVDDQYAPLSEKIRAAVAQLTPGPVRFVVNTHWHGDHTGGNEAFGRAGAVIVAHERVRSRMSAPHFFESRNATIPASPPAALPVVTHDAGLQLHWAGLSIEAIPAAPAHTDGDTLVHFVEADVLHLGDTFFNGMFPFIDLSSGGGIDGMIAAADRALALAGPETRIIPGHGPLATRADLVASRRLLVKVRDRVRKEIEANRTLEETLAARPVQEFEISHGGGFMSSEAFVEIVYRDLSQPASRQPGGGPENALAAPPAPVRGEPHPQ